MSETSARLALPFIVPGQAQKELHHNEALALIDAALHAAVESASVASPPSEPEEGQCWIIAAGAAGDWHAHAGSLACWTSGGWRFVAPLPGMLVWDKSSAVWLHWRGSSWSSGELPAAGLTIGGVQVVGARQPAVPSPSGGTTIDTEARTAIAAIAATLKTHGLIE
jgi:hypothetical protein